MPGCSEIARPTWRSPRRTTASLRRGNRGPPRSVARAVQVTLPALVTPSNGLAFGPLPAAGSPDGDGDSLGRVPTSAVPVSQSERAALADLLEQLGPDRPTCCEGWTTQD